jgi:hypothetical protein
MIAHLLHLLARSLGQPRLPRDLTQAQAQHDERRRR